MRAEKVPEEREKRLVAAEEADPELPPLEPPAVCDIPPGVYKVGVSVAARQPEQFPGWSFGIPEVYSIELVPDDESSD